MNQMTFAGHEIVIDLLDNPMAQAFLNRLPMTLTFEDFNGNEKKQLPAAETLNCG